MSELRIRSEATPEPIWPESFLPPRVGSADDAATGNDDFTALLAAAGSALSRLFGAAVTVVPGRVAAVAGEPVPRVSPDLAALLATLRFGGDPSRIAQATGVALARHAGAIAAVLDGVAADRWPAGCRLPGLDVIVECAGMAGAAHVAAPPLAPVVAPLPSAILALRLFELPMRVRIELASEAVLVASLMPLHAGTVVPISPSPEMPLLVGDHRIGRATLAPLADGRQQATIVAIAVEPLGGRP